MEPWGGRRLAIAPALVLIVLGCGDGAQPGTSAGVSDVPSAPVQQTRLGGFELTSVPAGARVWVDGKEVGWTPIRLADVAPGERTIRLEAEGRQAWWSQLHVTAGLVLELPTAELLPATDAGPRVVRLAAAPPIPSPALRPPAPLALPPPRRELPAWPRRSGFPPDFQVVLERNGSTVEGRVKLTIRALGQSAGSVTFETAREHRSSTCTFPIGRAAFDRFGFEQMLGALETGEGLRYHPHVYRPGVVACDFGLNFSTTTLRAFGTEVANDGNVRGMEEITARALDMIRGTRPWTSEASPEAMVTLTQLEERIALCIAYPGGAEIEYEVPRAGGTPKALAIGSSAHSSAELACVREALHDVTLPDGADCDLRVSLYVPGPPFESFQSREAGVIRLRARPDSALDRIIVEGDRYRVLDYPKSLVLLPAGKNRLELTHDRTHKRMHVVVDVARGREREHWVDLRKLR